MPLQSILQVAPEFETSSLEIARSVLQNEASALQELAKTLDERFDRAVAVIASLKGRVVVSGMGKSGHVARKIVATLASTGQPSFFVHPSEANHGDLGMITPDDAVIALSNSGETSEFSGLIDYTRRFSIPLISVTSKSESTLARVADVSLVLPDVPEACPMGLAPTTSTTLMMALGDALAIALLSLKGFSANDFRVFHPGGKLGNQLLRVADRMHIGKKIPLVYTTDLMSSVLIEISRKGVGCVGVVDESQCIQGVITDGDLRRHMNPDLLQKTAADVMTKNPICIHKDMLMSEALALMNQKAITTLFVVTGDSTSVPCGVIHIHDFLRSGTM